MNNKLLVILLFVSLFIPGCMSQKETSAKQEEGKANKLIHSSSPYLLQHAYNPVEWYPWGEEALQKAKKEDKPILVSIGYSSCHWCHVMEKESFENAEIAGIMNKNFVNIKVDREERPDIDQIYMEAVQLMNVRGGWPLNVFLTPEGKPFYGGTYYPPGQWSHLLNQVTSGFQNHRDKLEESAEEFARNLNFSEAARYDLKNSEASFTDEDLDATFQKLSKDFDRRLGGMNKAPKFPMPSVYMFLLRYQQASGNEEALSHVKLTLNQMARGGIYDQIGGGFARYSTDAEWFAPHFEKMLYDNGQLLSLYSEAYTVTGDAQYKEIVYETVAWLKREMLSPEGGFYSAQDADSEGEEGKFYVWTREEIEEVLKDDIALFSDYYNVKSNGNWEHNNNILHKTLSDKAFSNKHKIPLEELQEKVKAWKKVLLQKRNKRIHPGLDDKVLASWNGIMLKGLVDAYRAFDEPEFLELAENNATFIEEEMLKDGRLFHNWKSGTAVIPGYLEDYAFVSDGLTGLYEATFDEKWLNLAKSLTDTAIHHFYDAGEGFFFFTPNDAEKLIARKKELFDNVIPSSNSAMAINLHRLGVLYDNKEYLTLSASMLAKVKKLVMNDPGYMSNWGCLYSYLSGSTAEIAITGDGYLTFRKNLDKFYYPNKVVSGTRKESSLPLLHNRTAVNGKTTIFVCYDRTCKLPVHSVEDAVKQLEK